MENRHWFNINSREAPEPSTGRKGYALPPAVRRAQAKVSTNGGRAQCHFCKESFTVTYMAVCELGFMVERDWVCADCRKEKKVARAK